MAITTAATFGHVALHALRAILMRDLSPNSSASSPASSSASSVRPLVSGMTPDLLSQPVGDLGGERGHLRRVDAAGSLDVDRELGDDATGPRRQEHDTIGETSGLAHV